MFELGRKVIDKTAVDRCRNDSQTHRVAFGTTHKGQPRRDASGKFIGSFSLPFAQTIGRIFHEDTGLDLFDSKLGTGVWRSIQTETEFAAIRTWVQRQGTRIFLRDCLCLSVALDQNFIDNQSGAHTVLGDLEARAKTRHDDSAIAALVDHYCQAIVDLPGYRDARHIAAVPARPGKSYDLPKALVARIANRLSLEDLTPAFVFDGVKAATKSLDVDQKWASWERSRLRFDRALADDPAVILIDDKYQSGLSIQFVASRLYHAGASEVFGLCAVKTLRDSDNV